ncbi:MAG: response regulator transcription factor [Clostridia bacterium]|nr:response regulator transcription factor [Clostridia bacterium]
MNNKYKILLVEDEANIRNLVSAMLESAGYQVLSAGTCATAKVLYGSHRPDLIILDLGLPDRDGRTLLELVRRESATPVIVLSARSDEQDKVEALDMGANDYITKPFGSAELLARVRSALRSTHQTSGSAYLPEGKFRTADLVIDYDARRIFRGDVEVHLTQTEYNIVALLSRHPGKVLTYTAIIREIWGYPDEGSTKKLQVNMANIRKKLGVRPGENSYIVNELGVGYRMCAADNHS